MTVPVFAAVKNRPECVYCSKCFSEAMKEFLEKAKESAGDERLLPFMRW